MEIVPSEEHWGLQSLPVVKNDMWFPYVNWHWTANSGSNSGAERKQRGGGGEGEGGSSSDKNLITPT